MFFNINLFRPLVLWELSAGGCLKDGVGISKSSNLNLKLALSYYKTISKQDKAVFCESFSLTLNQTNLDLLRERICRYCILIKIDKPIREQLIDFINFDIIQKTAITLAMCRGCIFV